MIMLQTCRLSRSWMLEDAATLTPRAFSGNQQEWALYNSYIRDRFGGRATAIGTHGIVGFVTNGGLGRWHMPLDGIRHENVSGRRSLPRASMCSIFGATIRKNRVSKVPVRKKGGKIFSVAPVVVTPVAITLARQEPRRGPSTETHQVQYHDIGDYLTTRGEAGIDVRALWQYWRS